MHINAPTLLILTIVVLVFISRQGSSRDIDELKIRLDEERKLNSKILELLDQSKSEASRHFRPSLLGKPCQNNTKQKFVFIVSKLSNSHG